MSRLQVDEIVNVAGTAGPSFPLGISNFALAPGVVTMFAGAAAPPGWLLCDGSAVSRTVYADLFTAIGTVYGAGDTTTTFNLPNLVGRVALGLDAADPTANTLGQAGGTADSDHEHDITSDVTVVDHAITQPTFIADAHTHAVTSNVTLANHSVTQPAFTVNAHTHSVTTNVGVANHTVTNNAVASGNASVNTTTRTANVAIANHSVGNNAVASSTASANTTTRTANVAIANHSVGNNAVTSGGSGASTTRTQNVAVTVDAHTHGFAHVHQWGHDDVGTINDWWTRNTIDDSLATFTTGGSLHLTQGQGYTAGGNFALKSALPGVNHNFYTAGVLSPPTGADGAGAASSTQNTSTTTVTQPTFSVDSHTHAVTSNVTVDGHSVTTQPTFTVDAHTHTTTSNVTVDAHNVTTQPTFTVDAHTHTTTSNVTVNAHSVTNPAVTSANADVNGTTRTVDAAVSAHAVTNNAVTSASGSTNTTTRTTDVALSSHGITNNTVTSSGANVTENRGPYLVMLYIIKT